MSNEKIWIYEPLHASNVKRHETALRDILFNIPKNELDKHVFHVQAASGFLYYQDETQLWHNLPKKNLPKDKEVVRALATDFMKTANQKLTANKRLFDIGNLKQGLEPADKSPFSFPSSQFIDAQLILHPKHQFYDHWLVRFGVNLSTGARGLKDIPVENALLEFRLGSNGNVIGMNIRWRIMRRVLNADLFPYEQSTKQPEQTFEESAFDEQPEPALIYYLEDEATLQYQLVPYYKILSGHHSEYVPATKYSMLVKLIQENIKGDKARVTALVIGGSGDYEFEWSSWRHDNVLDEEVVDLGSGKKQTTPVSNDDRKKGFLNYTYSSIELEPGVHNVLVYVIDNKTFAVKKTEQTIYTNPIGKPKEEATA